MFNHPSVHLSYSILQAIEDFWLVQNKAKVRICNEEKKHFHTVCVIKIGKHFSIKKYGYLYVNQCIYFQLALLASGSPGDTLCRESPEQNWCGFIYWENEWTTDPLWSFKVKRLCYNIKKRNVVLFYVIIFCKYVMPVLEIQTPMICG